MSAWYVYMVRCSDGSLYTGISTDVTRRLAEHNHSNRLASAYTRSRRPVHLVYRETCQSRADASRREAALRQLSRQQKEQLVVDSGISG